MSSFVDLFTIYSITILPWVHSLVLTKLSAQLMTTYYTHARGHIYVEPDNEYEWLERDPLHEYCIELRRATVFNIVKEGDPTGGNVTPLHYRVPRNELTREKHASNNIQSITFLLDHLPVPAVHPSFPCLNLDGELKWFVSPAFIPDSAFLFNSKPDISYIFDRQLPIKDKIPADLVAIIDSLAKMTNTVHVHVQDILTDSIKLRNSSERDPLCDLNPIVQYRICAIAAASKSTGIHPLTEYTMPWIRQHGSSSSHHQPRNFNNNCRHVNLEQDIFEYRVYHNITLEMLYCPVISQNDDEVINAEIYLTSNMENPSRVIYLEKLNHHPDELIRSPKMLELQIPLLKHIKIYNKLFKNILINDLK